MIENAKKFATEIQGLKLKLAEAAFKEKGGFGSPVALALGELPVPRLPLPQSQATEQRV